MNNTPEQQTSRLAHSMQSVWAYLRTTPWPLLMVAAAFGLIDLICMPIIGSIGRSPWISVVPGIFLILCFAGCIASQFAAVSMWWAWSRSEVLWRTLIVIPVLILLACLWLGGEEMSRMSHVSIDRRILFLSTLISYGIPAGATPLLLMRKVFGWGILPTISEENHGFTRQNSIRDIMVATVIVAVLAALARQLMALSFHTLAEVLFFTIFAGIVSTITLLPLTYWILHDRMRQTGLSWALGFSALIPFVPLIIITSLSAGGGFISIEAVFMLFVVCYAYCGSVILMLYACRKAGFRLLTAWDKLPSDEIVILAIKKEPVDEREITFVED